MTKSSIVQSRATTTLVDKPVQFALVGRVLIHWALFFVLGLAVGIANSLLQRWQIDLRSLMDDQFLFVVVAILMLPVFVLDTFKLSHRVVGPMVRFRRCMRDLADGRRTPPLCLRPGDAWGGIAHDFNRLIARLQLVRQWENESLPLRELAGELAIHESHWADHAEAPADLAAMAEETKEEAGADSQQVVQRKTLYVDDIVQGTMMRRVLAQWSLYLAVNYILAIALMWLLDPIGGLGQAVRVYLKAQAPCIVTAIFLVAIFAWDIVTLTHRIAGPMVQLRQQLRELSLGRPASHVKFRPSDFWHEVATDFNAMCDRVQPRFEALQQYIQNTPVYSPPPTRTFLSGSNTEPLVV